ncbi:hypothetical protein B4U80_14541 [Leptotrombidium deliense]|uniref:Uncharacterized protein n=1 Tax=Leptotrombidium deliense TaxID=299467 RepID=A0A443RUI4_9ACAR|nr:hypothetical protein B4U80_14541 [Leptotrombidium deliense]
MLITSGLLVLSTPIYVYLKSKKLEITKKSEMNGEITTTNDSKQQTKNSEKQAKESHWKRFKIYLLLLCSTLLFIYYALGDSVIQFWLTFVVNCDLKLTKSKAAFMLSALNAAYSVSALIGIYATAKVKPFKMIVTLLIMIAVGNIIHVLVVFTPQFLILCNQKLD